MLGCNGYLILNIPRKKHVYIGFFSQIRQKYKNPQSDANKKFFSKKLRE